MLLLLSIVREYRFGMQVLGGFSGVLFILDILSTLMSITLFYFYMNFGYFQLNVFSLSLMEGSGLRIKLV